MRVVMDEKDNAAATMEVMITVKEANAADPGKFRAVMPVGVGVSIYQYGDTRQAAAEACAVYAMKLLSLDIEAPSGTIINVPHIAKDRDFREAIIACDKLLTTKGNDYVGGDKSGKERLKNFYDGSEFLGQTPFQVLGVYFYKHITAIFTFLKNGKVESEAIEGRIYDAINYLLLMIKMIAVEKGNSEGIPTTITNVQKGPSVYVSQQEPVPMAIVDNQGLVK